MHITLKRESRGKVWTSRYHFSNVMFIQIVNGYVVGENPGVLQLLLTFLVRYPLLIGILFCQESVIHRCVIITPLVIIYPSRKPVYEYHPLVMVYCMDFARHFCCLFYLFGKSEA